MLKLFSRFVTITVLGLLVAGGGALGYRSVQNKVAADVYRTRLVEMAGQYESLRETYNDVVRRTAVTELLVNEGKLSIIVRTAEGVTKTIETPFDPSGEIYVDYVIVDGRLWIRRVFDDITPPAHGLVIDPMLQHVSWESGGARVGKAVYRSLDEGRWVVTVSGNGSLGLERAGEAEVSLSSPPAVGDPAELVGEVDARVSEIGVGDVWGWMTTWNRD